MDNYDPLKILGEGAFGKVYLMKHKARKRLVCVKVIKIKSLPQKDREACCQEVSILQRLNHPNIVGYEDSFLSPKRDALFIVMQYCDGGDLSSRIKAAGGHLFAESKVLHWFVQIALGLEHMHSHRIMHRDIKAQNIFLLGNGRLVLGDLGISKVLDATSDFAETLIGTPYYMSPEIFQNQPYDYKSDIWALGCVLYETTTLLHPFEGSNLNSLALKVIKGRYAPIDERYSTYLRDLIGEMLSTDPARRPGLDSIIKKTFIKKHVQEFFTDIISRPSSTIGISSPPPTPTDPNCLNQDGEALRRQLEGLELHNLIARAINPPEHPTSARGALRVAKEQTGALEREEERMAIVEETLAKLRAEREARIHKRHHHNTITAGVGRGNRVISPMTSREDKGGLGMGPGSPLHGAGARSPETTPTANPKPVLRSSGSSGGSASSSRPPVVSSSSRPSSLDMEDRRKSHERRGESLEPPRTIRMDSHEKNLRPPIKYQDSLGEGSGGVLCSHDRGKSSPRLPPCEITDASKSPTPSSCARSVRRRSTGGCLAHGASSLEEPQPLTPQERLRSIQPQPGGDGGLTPLGRDRFSPELNRNPKLPARPSPAPSPQPSEPSRFSGGSLTCSSALQEAIDVAVHPSASTPKKIGVDRPQGLKPVAMHPYHHHHSSSSCPPTPTDYDPVPLSPLPVTEVLEVDDVLWHREEELQKELEAATQRCETIKMTLRSLGAFHSLLRRKTEGARGSITDSSSSSSTPGSSFVVADGAGAVDDEEDEEELVALHARGSSVLVSPPHRRPAEEP